MQCGLKYVQFKMIFCFKNIIIFIAVITIKQMRQEALCIVVILLKPLYEASF